MASSSSDSGAADSPTTSCGLYYRRSTSMACRLGFAFDATFRSALSSADTRSEKRLAYAVKSLRFQHPSWAALSSSNTLLSSASMVSRVRPQLATGHHYSRLAGFRCSSTAAMPVGCTLVSMRSSSARSMLSHRGVSTINRATCRTASPASKVQGLASYPNRACNSLVTSAKVGTYSR